jgi:alginate O-acetyltransferase complex protein AlgI
VIFLSILIGNYLFKNQKYSEEKKKYYLVAGGIGINIVFLGFFKYFNFFIDNFEWLIKALNMDPARFHLQIVLPIGISFYTFKAISYLVDVYKGVIKPEGSYVNFSLFMAFFPSLLAGPIDRAKNLLSQFAIPRKPDPKITLEGLHLIFYGLFKKIVVADGVVRTVNSVFNSTGNPSWIDVVAATSLFTIQIYCDFSGYTDMARGTAKLFGIDLMVNFNLPYFSKSPRDFWSRWHISLSTWLRDYLYIPLGGNRAGKTNTYRNLMITMVLGGLWHGAAWNFIFWGFYHGLILCLHRMVSGVRFFTGKMVSPIINSLKIILVLGLISYGWLLFRAPSLDTIVRFSSTLLYDFGNMDFGAMRPKAAAVLGVVLLLCIECIEYFYDGEPFWKKLPMPAWTAIYSFIIFGFFLSLGNESGKFIYFNF